MGKFEVQRRTYNFSACLFLCWLKTATFILGFSAFIHLHYFLALSPPWLSIGCHSSSSSSHPVLVLLALCQHFLPGRQDPPHKKKFCFQICQKIPKSFSLQNRSQYQTSFVAVGGYLYPFVFGSLQKYLIIQFLGRCCSYIFIFMTQLLSLLDVGDLEK